jgi:gamma-glutamyl-gamma-aminobutyrate hydrolase PuuD
MKRIAVTQRVVIDTATGERRDALDQRWTEFLAACGVMPIPVPNQPETALALIQGCNASGILLTGGNDLVGYGGDAPERDITESRLIDWARWRGLPVLGVCRGMQMLLSEFGAEIVPCEGHVRTTHQLAIGGNERQVNSFHRLGIRTLPPGFREVARAKDGVLEAASHLSEPLTGIMWHPERAHPFDPADIAFVHGFFERVPCAA